MVRFCLFVAVVGFFATRLFAETPEDWEHATLGVHKPCTLAVGQKLLAVACEPTSKEEGAKILLLRTTDHSLESEFSGGVLGIAASNLWFSHNDKVLLVPNALGLKTIVAWDIEKQQVASMSPIPFNGYPNDAGVNAESSSTAPFMLVESEAGRMQFYGEDCQPIGQPFEHGWRKYAAQTGYVDGIVFAPTYAVFTGHLIGMNDECRIVAWEYVGGKWNFRLIPEKRALKIPGRPGKGIAKATSVAVAPGNDLAAIGTLEGVALLKIDLNARVPAKISLLPENSGKVYGVTFLSDGRLVAAGEELAIHDLQKKTKVVLATFDDNRVGSLAHLAVTPDDYAIYGIVGDKEPVVHVWKRKGKAVATKVPAKPAP